MTSSVRLVDIYIYIWRVRPGATSFDMASVSLAMPMPMPSAVHQAREPLLQHQHCGEATGGDGETFGEAGGGDGSGGSFPWLPAAGLGYLTFSSAMAVRRSRGDPAAVAFVAFAYLDLVLLLCCLRLYERAAAGSALRARLKAAVWLLTAALTLAFSCKVAAVVPAAAAVLVWATGLATVAGGFVALFCLPKA
ncbi:hypothetical protein ACP4OV_009273 [Aristida adscensionis]